MRSNRTVNEEIETNRNLCQAWKPPPRVPLADSSWPGKRWMETTVTSTIPDSGSAGTVLKTQAIELPSWAFGNSGTRFKVFAQKGVPRTAYELSLIHI